MKDLMNRIKSLLFIFCFLSAMTEHALAQQGFVSSGGEATGPGGSMSFSMGQTDYTSAGPGGSVSQGNQQPYEVVNAVQQVNDKNNFISVYPNPASDFIVIKTNTGAGTELTYELLDQQGKLLLITSMTGEKSLVSFENLPNAAYFLRVIERGKSVGEFKIIKNK